MIPIYDIKDFSPFYAKERQFVIVPFENLNRPAPFVWPHKHSFYEILWIRKGIAKHFVDNQELDLSTDTIYFMSPGQAHHFEKYEAIKGDSIMFTEEFFILNFINKEALQQLSFLDDSYRSPNIKLDDQTKQVLEPLLKLLYAEFDRPDYSTLAISSLLYVFLNCLQRVYLTQDNNSHLPSNHTAIFNNFKRLLEQYYKEQKKLSFYSEELFITPHYLNEVVKNITGKTASEFVQDRLLLEAKRMLVQSHFQIGQIADELGFKDFSYFSRHFKKHNKLSPEQYRNNMHEKHGLS
jgi:AraC family transcriptional activator of pobA